MNALPNSLEFDVPASSKTDRGLLAIYAFYGLLIAAQVFLVFTKSFNWDEFYHFSMVHDLPKGRLTWDFQTLYIRLFLWVPAVTDDLIAQLQIARLGMLCFELVAVAMIVRLAREFVDHKAALVTGIAYLAGGYIFTQGFSFRTDPVATAPLMMALYLFATKDLTIGRLLTVGVLVGLAGLVTIKSIFYAPCFLAFAIRRLMDSPAAWRAAALRIAAVPIVALLTFVVVLQLHRIGLDVRAAGVPSLEGWVSAFLGDGPGERTTYIFQQMELAPVITAGVLLSLLAVLRLPRRNAIATLGLLLPLLTLLFYRNTFPYFFVFLLAPVCVGIAPAIGLLLKFSGTWIALAVLAISPVSMLRDERYHVLERQEALVGEVHRLFPQPVGYLAYAGFIADYPRILPHLISGVGLQGYYDRKIPVIAQEIERGNVAFALSDSKSVRAGLQGRTMPNSLQPRDFTMLHENFVHYHGIIWIAGKTICPAQGEQSVTLYRTGPYSIDGGPIVIDGTAAANGSTRILQAGQHRVVHQTGNCIRLWALPKVPRVPQGYPAGALFTLF